MRSPPHNPTGLCTASKLCCAGSSHAKLSCQIYALNIKLPDTIFCFLLVGNFLTLSAYCSTRYGPAGHEGVCNYVNAGWASWTGELAQAIPGWPGLGL